MLLITRFLFNCIQGITTDSRVSEAAPPRTVHGIRVDDMEEYYRNLKSFKELNSDVSSEASSFETSTEL